MNYYSYIDFNGKSIYYIIIEGNINEYYKTVPAKIIKFIDKQSFLNLNTTYSFDIDRVKIVSNKKIIKELDKLMVFQNG